jgi:hypothetical protein
MSGSHGEPVFAENSLGLSATSEAECNFVSKLNSGA